MDERTSQYYAANVKEAAELYVAAPRGTGVSRYFAEAFPAGSSVLDMGCGSGRDVSSLLVLGYDAYGIDGTAGMVKFAIEHYPQLRGRVKQAVLPHDGLYFNKKFNCILCSAILMHITQAEIFDAAYTIRNNLEDGGRLLVSVPLEREGLDEEGRDAKGRLFEMRRPEYYILLFERLGFRKIGYHEDEDSFGRTGARWCSIIFSLESGSGSRSLDKIESVLNRDRKTATYKLALIRALADIASTEYNSVKWYADGTVGVEVRRIAERWIVYYWPLFESERFIPQINGESRTCRKPVKFRKELTGLIDAFRPAGGLAPFYNMYMSGDTGQHAVQVKNLLKQVEETIIKGPVYYSGGLLEAGRIFSYNTADKMVVIPADIWRELCLMWHWIADALILRWGELTSSMSGGEIPASQVIDLLLTENDADRDATISRRLFGGIDALECIWTGRRIGGDFHVDHVIPYSLWHNNDLWNLLPASPKANSSKSDKLPTRRLLNERREIMSFYWDLIEKRFPARFSFEVKRFTGISAVTGKHDELFSAVASAVEITAVQRGVDRWDG